MKITTLTSGDERSVPGYLAEPANPNGAAVVLLQEYWGLNAQIQGVADRLASTGYRVFVPDLYRGNVAKNADEANHMMTGLDWKNAYDHDVRTAVEALGTAGARVAVMGFCMGGALALLAASRIAEISAVVCYYGIPPEEAADLTRIQVPVLGHFATRDTWCDAKAVSRLEAALSAGGAAHAIHWYEADHAFVNEARPEVFDAGATEQSWELSLTFLAKNLSY